MKRSPCGNLAFIERQLCMAICHDRKGAFTPLGTVTLSTRLDAVECDIKVAVAWTSWQHETK